LQSKDDHIGSDQIQCHIEVLKPERTAQHRISIHELKVQKNGEGNKDLREELHQIYKEHKEAARMKIGAKSWHIYKSKARSKKQEPQQYQR